VQSTSAGGVPSAHTSDRCTRLSQGARCSHVIEAAIRLFAQKGFEGTKTKEIAEAAGINEALIFRDFQTKENLYCAIIADASSRVSTECAIAELSPYAERRDDEGLFFHLAVQVFETASREQTLFRLMIYCALEHHKLARKFREKLVAPVEHFLEDYLRTRQDEGAFRAADPHALARSFLDMCHHHVLRHVIFRDGTKWPPDAAAAKICADIFLNGVRSH